MTRLPVAPQMKRERSDRRWEQAADQTAHQGFVRTTRKVNGKSENYSPATPNPLTVIKIYQRDYVMDVNHPAKFHPDRIKGFVSAHARFRASNCLLGYLFVYSLFFMTYTAKTPRTEFDAKYVKRRGFAQGFSFWGHTTKS